MEPKGEKKIIPHEVIKKLMKRWNKIGSALLFLSFSLFMLIES